MLRDLRFSKSFYQKLVEKLLHQLSGVLHEEIMLCQKMLSQSPSVAFEFLGRLYGSFLKWYTGKLRYESDKLLAHAQRIHEGRELVNQIIPGLGNSAADYEVAHIKSCFEGYFKEGKIIDHEVEIKSKDPDNPEIYLVFFSSDEYPEMNISKGFAVRKLNDLGSYKGFLDFSHLTPQYWQNIPPEDVQFSQMVGITLLGTMDALTEFEDSRHLNQCLNLYEFQASNQNVQ